MADLKARLGKAKAEFDAHRMAESDTLTSQIAQQTTIQHNLVEELTEAKSAELAAKTRIRELEARRRGDLGARCGDERDGKRGERSKHRRVDEGTSVKHEF